MNPEVIQTIVGETNKYEYILTDRFSQVAVLVLQNVG